MARVTLADVADAVGVSAKSVSNVVNGTGWVGEETRKRILAAVDELGYRPNLAARQLRGGTSGVLALAIPDLREPYFAEFVSRFVTAAQERALNALIVQTGGERTAEKRAIEGNGLPALDGVVVSPLQLTSQDIRQHRGKTPLILVGEHGQEISEPPAVHIGADNGAAARAATSCLLKNGRKRVGVIGVQEEGSKATSRQRFQGYQSALEEAGIPFDTALVGNVTDFNRSEGARATEGLLKRGADFDGLFCFNDTLALGALHVLAANGISVPDAVEIIGFDDIDEGRFATPPLSTVNLGISDAADIILDIVEGHREIDGGHVTVPFSVVQRSTTR